MVPRPSSSSSSSLLSTSKPWWWWLLRPSSWRETSTTSCSSELGTIWHAEDAVQTWCQGELCSLDGGGERLRLLICNDSEEDLVYSWITPRGKIHGFRTLKSRGIKGTTSTNNKRQAVEVVEDDEDEQPDPHVERTFVGHAFVFGRLRHPNPKELKDVIVLGAYRSNQVSLSSEKPDFPCHKLTIQPPPPPESGFLCCPSLCPSSSSSQKNSYLRGTSPRNRSQPKKDNNNNKDDETTKDPSFYDTDPSWTLHIREWVISQQKLLDTTSTHTYIETTLCDWPVYLEKGCFQDDNNETTKQVFCRDLQYALDHLPVQAREKLKCVPCHLWINKCGLRYGPQQAPETLRHLCFHPGASWLLDNRMHPQKVKCVEVYDVQNYCQHDRDFWGTGGVLIHELSHAYHNTCLPDGYDNADIQDCYDKAMKEGLYNKVAVHGSQGPMAKAYACQDAMEYFAELSTAFLGGLSDQEEYNKWYPFNRAQLKQHDPRAYDMLCRLWNVTDTE